MSRTAGQDDKKYLACNQVFDVQLQIHKPNETLFYKIKTWLYLTYILSMLFFAY